MPHARLRRSIYINGSEALSVAFHSLCVVRVMGRLAFGSQKSSAGKGNRVDRDLEGQSKLEPGCERYGVLVVGNVKIGDEAEDPLVFFNFDLLCGQFFIRCVDVFAVAAQEVIDRFDADANKACGLVLIEILGREVRISGILDDPLDDSINRSVVTALETRNFKGDKVRMPRGELGCPYFVVGAGGISILPEIADVE